MNKKYNEFIQQKPNTMAQTISDMTFAYNGTEVPPTHYKKILEERIEEEMHVQLSYEMLNIYVKQLKHLYEESPLLFIKALTCLDEKIKPLDVRPKEILGLNAVANYYQENMKKIKLLNEKITDEFKNGQMDFGDNQQNEELN